MWWTAVILVVLAWLLALVAVALEDPTWQGAAFLGFAFSLALFMLCLVFGALKERGRLINQASDTGVQQRDTGHA